MLEVGLLEKKDGFEQHLRLLEFEHLYAGEVEVHWRRVLSRLEYNERNRVISYIHPACVHLCPGLNASIVYLVLNIWHFHITSYLTELCVFWGLFINEDTL